MRYRGAWWVATISTFLLLPGGAQAQSWGEGSSGYHRGYLGAAGLDPPSAYDGGGYDYSAGYASAGSFGPTRSLSDPAYRYAPAAPDSQVGVTQDYASGYQYPGYEPGRSGLRFRDNRQSAIATTGTGYNTQRIVGSNGRGHREPAPVDSRGYALRYRLPVSPDSRDSWGAEGSRPWGRSDQSTGSLFRPEEDAGKRGSSYPSRRDDTTAPPATRYRPYQDAMLPGLDSSLDYPAPFGQSPHGFGSLPGLGAPYYGLW